MAYKPFANNFPPRSFAEWWTDLGFYILDICLIPDIYRLLARWLIKGLRPLTAEEIDIARNIFGDTIRYEKVRMNSRSRFTYRSKAIAFVTFDIINYTDHISTPVFIHEMVHVWQYTHFGVIYIPKALRAQNSKEGYNYGGVENLYKAMNSGKKLTDFNFEQQGDIIEDYFKLSFQHRGDNPMSLQVYSYFANQLYGVSDQNRLENQV